MEDSIDLEKYEEEFENAVETVRHKQLLHALKTISVEIGKQKENGLNDALDKHFKNIEKLISSISGLEIKAPIVNVSSDNKEIAVSFKQMADSLMTEISGLRSCIDDMNKKRSLSFTRDRNGFIMSPIEIK